MLKVGDRVAWVSRSGFYLTGIVRYLGVVTVAVELDRDHGVIRVVLRERVAIIEGVQDGK